MSVEGGFEKDQDYNIFSVPDALLDPGQYAASEIHTDRTVVPVSQSLSPMRGSDIQYQRSLYTGGLQGDIKQRIDEQNVCNLMGSFAGDNGQPRIDGGPPMEAKFEKSTLANRSGKVQVPKLKLEKVIGGASAQF